MNIGSGREVEAYHVGVAGDRDEGMNTSWKDGVRGILMYKKNY